VAKRKAAKKKAAAKPATKRSALQKRGMAHSRPYLYEKRSGIRNTRVWMPSLSDPTPAIHVGNEVFPVNEDKSVVVPVEQVQDFLKMGCKRTRPTE